MRELIEYIYSKLSIIGDTYFEDLDRDEEGKAIIDDIKIVYNIPNVLKITDNKCRSDIILEIDIWGRKEQTLEIEDLVEKINNELEDEVYRNDKLFFIIKKSNTWILNLKDEDKNIRHKRINYIIKLFK